MRNSKSLKANFKFKYLSADIRAAESFAMALRSCDTLPVLYVAKKENGIWSEQRLRTFNQKFSPMVNANTDCYVSVNDFSLETEHRSNIGTTFINGLFFDTDFHKKSNTETDNGICRCIDILDREIENGNFPPLSMVTLTGRGIGKFIVYKQDIYTGDKKRVELHKKVYAAIIRRLQKYWDEAKIEAEEDRSVTDFARVCRLPGTYNTKAKRYATLAYKDTTHLLTLEEIAQYFSTDELEYTENIEVESIPVSKTSKFEDCAMRRKQFLERECDCLKEGDNREIRCWLYLNTVMTMYDFKDAVKMLEFYNRRFAEPLSVSEIKKIVKELSTHGAYKFTEAKFYGYLGVNIPKKCAIRRHTKKEKEEIKAKKISTEKKVCRMRKDGKTVEDIKKACKLSRATVYKILKKYDLDKKIFKYEQSQKALISDEKMSTFAIYEDNTIAQGCSIPAQESLSTDDKSPVRSTKEPKGDSLALKEMDSGSLSLFSQRETIPLAVIVFPSDYCVSKVTGG